MGVLMFAKPKKARPSSEHNVVRSDNLVPGNYESNMSQADKERWKAKHIRRGTDPRVEIRKTVGGFYATFSGQMLMVVRPDGSVRLSMNSKLHMSKSTFEEFQTVYEEALRVLAGQSPYIFEAEDGETFSSWRACKKHCDVHNLKWREIPASSKVRKAP